MNRESRAHVASHATGIILGALVGGIIEGVVSRLAHDWAPDPALAAIGLASAIVAGIAFYLIYRRYADILARRTAAARRRYDALRQSLSAGGLAAATYSRRLAAALGAVDRFFGDAGMAERTLFPHAFGLRTPAPLWTAAAFDRCLLLALLYPVATIIMLWGISGHVGPAEHALLLPGYAPSRYRAGALVMIVVQGYGSWRFIHASGWTAKLWLAVAAAASVVFYFVSGSWGAPAFIFAIANAFAFAVTLAGAVAVAAPVVLAGDFALAGAVAVAAPVAFAIAFAVAVAVVVAFAGADGVAVVVAGGVAVAVVVAVVFLSDWARQGRLQGPLQAALIILLAAACLAGAGTLGQSRGWPFAGALLLFLGLLTLLNAPFDWAALGLTRALLRRGLERGAWYPYAFAIADALAAALVIALLTLACVLGVQAFDDLAALSGGHNAVILPLDALFDGIAARPAAPEFWWVYAMLLSTMVPSLVNLAIGGASLLRGIPWVTAFLLGNMPERGTPPGFDRPWMTLLLTAQVFVGGLLGIAAQGLLVYVVIGWLLPLFGFDLLDLARAVAAPDLPDRIIRWFVTSFG